MTRILVKNVKKDQIFCLDKNIPAAGWRDCRTYSMREASELTEDSRIARVHNVYYNGVYTSIQFYSFLKDEYRTYLFYQDEAIPGEMLSEEEANKLKLKHARTNLYSLLEGNDLLTEVNYCIFIQGLRDRITVKMTNDRIDCYNSWGDWLSNQSGDGYRPDEDVHGEDVVVKRCGLGLKINTERLHCLEELHGSISTGMRAVLNAAQEQNKNAKISHKTVWTFPAVLPKTSVPKADNSVNAYGLKKQKNVDYQSGSCWVKFEQDGGDKIKNPERIVKMIDAIAGVAAVSLLSSIENPKSRTVACQPGDFSLKEEKCCLEYRGFTNAVLCHPFASNLLFGIARKAFLMVDDNLDSLWEASEEDVIKCIMTNDAKLARKILVKNQNILKQMLQAEYGRDLTRINFLYSIILDGIESIVKDPTDIIENWKLENYDIWDNLGRDLNVSNSLRILLNKTPGKKL